LRLSIREQARTTVKSAISHTFVHDNRVETPSGRLGTYLKFSEVRSPSFIVVLYRQLFACRKWLDLGCAATLLMQKVKPSLKLAASSSPAW